MENQSVLAMVFFLHKLPGIRKFRYGEQGCCRNPEDKNDLPPALQASLVAQR